MARNGWDHFCILETNHIVVNKFTPNHVDLMQLRSKDFMVTLVKIYNFLKLLLIRGSSNFHCAMLGPLSLSNQR